ncbi:MAG: S9 family peptidase, partial [Blastocatellia bacterium]
QGKYLLYNKDTAGDELFQFYLYDFASRGSRLLTDGKSRNTEPVWSNAGDKIAFSSSPRGSEGVDLSIMNPFDPKGCHVAAPGHGNYLKAYDWSPDDRQVVFCDYVSNTVSSLWVLNVSTGQKRMLNPKKEPQSEYYDEPAFSKDGKGVYVVTDRDSEFRRLAYVDLATLKYKYLTDRFKSDVEEFAQSPNGKTVAFITNEGGVSRLHWLSPEDGNEKSAESLPAGIISDLKWRDDSADLAFDLKSPQTPNDVYSINTRTGEVARWYKGFLGQLDAGKLPLPEPIHWRSFDGRLISGFLYRPPATFSGRRPVIIDVHGGPEEQYRPGFGYDDNYFIDELGIVRIYPNIRGSIGFGKTFASLDNGVLRQNSIKDIGALLDWIADQPGLDANRVV